MRFAASASFGAICLATLAAQPAITQPAIAQSAARVANDGEAQFRELYRSLVETDTTLSSGSCTRAAQVAADYLAQAGMPRENLHVMTDPGHPEEGSLVAIYPGSDPAAGAVLLMAHLDVVEALRADWERDPFTLYEEDGWFYARGTADDKSDAAIWTDILARFARDDLVPRRTVKLALTCGEETNGAFNGAQWLAANHRDLIDADFALNEGGGGGVDADGNVIIQSVQVGEKIFANYELEVRNPGGHSSGPRPDNAIYQLANALSAIEAHEFPVEFTDVTRQSLTDEAASQGGLMGAALLALMADPSNRAADAVVSTDAYLRSNTRTTCVATMLDAGHARNALPQRAGANINCRIFPGHSIEEIRAELAAAIGDDGVVVTTLEPVRPAPPAPPLTEELMGPIRTLVAEHYPQARLTVSMSNGYTDSTFMTAVGIPAYGAPGGWYPDEPSGVHGLNERIPVAALMDARAFKYDLVRAYVE